MSDSPLVAESKKEKKRPGPAPKLTNSEKKRRRQALDKKTNRSRINIGVHLDEWMEIKTEFGLESNAEVARFLINRFKESRNVESATTMTTSTPAVKQRQLEPMIQEEMSGISSELESCGVQSDFSGVEPIERKPQGPLSLDRHSSFVDPFQVSGVMFSEDSSDEDSDDVDYEPSMNITLGLHDYGPETEEVRFGDVELDDDGSDADADEDSESSMNTAIGPGVRRVLSESDKHLLTEDETFLVYKKCLISLATTSIPVICPQCGNGVELRMESIGSAFYMKWVCKADHLLHVWCSHPVLNMRLHGGDLMLASSILLSGNNFAKAALMARFLKLHFVSQSSFQRIQRTYLVPSVEKFWQKKQEDILDNLDGDLVMLGDGRMDSPGHCAQYCTYTAMDNASKKIVSIVTMDKREVGGKSANMEKGCFVKTIQELETKDVRIKEVVTDAHLQISALMRRNYPNIKHSFDIWHAAKSLGKKFTKVGQEKECRELLEWGPHVVRHFWHAAQIANTEDEFMGIWHGVVHHVVDVHDWAFAYGDGRTECSHGPLADDRPAKWLVAGSPAHKALVKIVLDKRFLNKIPYFVNFRSTAELENFQTLILMYASKRHSYIPPVYRARCLLAGLDQVHHADREVLVNKDGSIRNVTHVVGVMKNEQRNCINTGIKCNVKENLVRRRQCMFNKKSARWTVLEVKSPKTYPHIPHLINMIVEMRLKDDIGMQRLAQWKQDDPRKISANIASVPRPDTAQLVADKKSRFKEQ